MHKEEGMRQVKLPMSDAIVQSLVVGEPVMLSGVILTGRDSVHKWMYDTLSGKPEPPKATIWISTKRSYLFWTVGSSIIAGRWFLGSIVETTVLWQPAQRPASEKSLTRGK